MKFCVLASGSKGNAVWVESEGHALLIDCGLSAREFFARVRLSGLDCSRLRAIVITHEHSDHIKGAGPLARKLKVPLLANQSTAANASPVVGAVTWDHFRTGDHFQAGPFRLRAFHTSHDAVDPVGLRVEDGSGAGLGLATDLGAPTNLVREELKGLPALILEFNHDYRLLMEGPYPWPLKQRVRGRTGHLDNETAAELAGALLHRDLRHLVLAHLSEVNNNPELALSAARRILGGILEPRIASQHCSGPVLEI